MVNDRVLTRIPVSIKVKDKLKVIDLSRNGDKHDNVIVKLIEFYEKHKEE